MDVRTTLLQSYSWLASRPALRPLNEILLKLAARGLGVNNYDGTFAAEGWLLKYFVARSATDAPLTVFDGGANGGDYSLLVRRIVPNALIHAFEPHPRTFERLTANTRNHNIHCHPLGLGSSVGETQLWDYAADEGGSTHASLHGDALKKTTGAPLRALPISITTIDQFAADHGIRRINFLKIDVEGHELACLEGAERMLREQRIGMIQFEFNALQAHLSTTMQRYFLKLEGYHFYRLLNRGLVPLVRDDVMATNLFGYQIIVAIPDRPNSLQEQPLG